MIDLHTHSQASDGALTPTQLVNLAQRQNISALALTDHDTILGLEETRCACLSRKILFIPGIELQIEYGDREFHLLGLNLKRLNVLDSILVDVQEWRRQRNWKILEKMKHAGMQGDFSEVEFLTKTSQIGRFHLANFLVNQGRAKSLKEAFSRFLSRGGLFYEKKQGLDLNLAIDLIHRAGGIAVLAHPMSLGLSFFHLEESLIKWRALGLDALEAWHPGFSVNQCQRLEFLAKKLELKWSAGSDFHEETINRQLGFTAGKRPIPEEILQSLFEGNSWLGR